MKLLTVLMLIVFATSAADSYSQATKFNLRLNNVSVKQVFQEIENNSEFILLYNEKNVELNRKVSINVNDKTVESILDQLFKVTDNTYKIYDRQIVILEDENADVHSTFEKYAEMELVEQQQKEISGIVREEDGNPLPGVSVIVKGTSIGTVTDTDGRFTLSIPLSAEVLAFSFIGMQSQEIPIGDKTEFAVSLSEEEIGLDEVVVVGYGTQKKANLTGAVDQVTGEVFENRAMSNITQGLQGVMPNLNITLPDGKPNTSPSYNIRGTTSIGQGGNALVLIDGVEGDPSLINPNDIESISLLKDAASASIYGARAVFGVVLITTRNPSKEKTSITYSGNIAMKSPVVIPDYVWDGYTWAKMFNEATYNWEGSYPSKANKTIRFSQEYLEELKRRSENPDAYTKDWDVNPENGEYVYYGSTDWYDLLYKDFTTANDHNITVSGSSETTSFMISGRYLGQNGLYTYNTDDYEMLNFRAKGSIQVFPWLRFDSNSQYSSSKYHNPLQTGEGGNVWRNIADEGNPMSPLFNPDGTLTHTSVYHVGNMWYGKSGYDLSKRVFKSTNGFVAQFLDNKLRVKGDFTFQNTNDDQKRIRVKVPYDKSPGVTSYVGTKYDDILDIWRNTKYTALNIYSEYENTLNEKHFFKILVGYNYEESLYRKLEAERNGLIFEDAIDISLALGEDINVDGSYTAWNILGGFSRLNYSFKDRYLFEVNARYDGSSKFPSNERYALFPSYSIGWRISNESFWNVSDDLISNLKLRASYGSLGNGNIAAYVYQEIFEIGQSGDILGGTKPQTTSKPEVIPDGLTWETATTFNIGLDIAMASNRLIFVGDIYQRDVTDMFTIGMTLPAVFGATAPKGNYADMETKGWEVALSWRDKFILKSKPFNYNLRLTLADNKSVITRYNNPDKNLDDYYEGMVVGEIWGYTNDGFFEDQADIDSHADQSRFKTTNARIIFPGDIKLKDINGDGKVDPGTNRFDDPGDRKIIGNEAPRYTFGINLGADWNSFFFSTFFQGVGRQDWYPSREASAFWGQYNRPYNPLPRWHLDNHWTPENPDAYMPRYVGRVANRSGGILRDNPQTDYLQNIAYIRLKNIQVGYNLPMSLISKIGAQNAKVYFSGENLWTWSPLYKITRDLDVENTGARDALLGGTGDGYNYPMLKSLSIGLTVTF
ncbi:TonB-dependent receptor [Draconibacterium halophilum]|uniref:TonB-dependent receptor n=1 Tax=Draconibacterium halophilum TaxID=2706887 RepID=A0A6C0RF93_9BACT|nr:TonB-dependent receptor [Draconibacterium halophilum]QIA08345.1 TonB-dependent receptor [Draconibacterium halophilum]